ncbi:MAG: flavodoxin family protein [Clostridiales bacterium]|nr:flavodoxin family protein [Clostridiales bacterium]
MKKIVLYYSRTGNSKRVAEKIGEGLGVEIIPIVDENKYKGAFGFLKAGFYSSKWKKVKYTVDLEEKINDDTHVYFVSPVWANHSASVVYSFLMDNDIKIKSIVFTNKGSSPEKAYSAMEEKFGNFQNKYCITNSKNNEDEIIKLILKEGSN